MTNKRSQDLDWLAFCYVKGELSGDELADWEARLADDQTAREAVAAAVELVLAVECAEDSRQVRRKGLMGPGGSHERTVRRIWARRLVWISAVAATLVVSVVSGMRWLDRGANSDARQHATGADSTNQLALVWSETRRATRSDLEAQDSTTGADADGSDNADEWRNGPDPDNHLGDRQLPATPSWITAAMDGLDSESDRLGPGDDQF